MTIPVFPTGHDALSKPADHRVVAPNEFPLSMRDWLDILNVEYSARYQPRDGRTFCNVFACDTAMGWLPRLLWVTPQAEKAGTIRYNPGGDRGNTVFQVNANGLCGWAVKDGARHGWSMSTLTEWQHPGKPRETYGDKPKPVSIADLIEYAHEEAKAGHLVLFMAPNRDPKRSGHVVVVLPPPPGYSGTSLYHAGAGRVCVDPGWWSLESIAKHGPPVVLSRPWAGLQSREGLVIHAS